MLPSSRFLKLFVLGLVPALLSAGSPAFYYLTVLYGLGLGLLFFADYFLGLNPRSVTVTRALGGRFSLGEENRVQLRVRNFSRTRVRVTLTDDFPVSFAAKEDRLSGEIPPFGERVFEYRVTPPQRGLYEFGSIHVRLESGLRLATRQWQIPAPQQVRVFPNLKGIAKYEAMSRKSHLWELGLRPSRRVGQGTEFERLREYAPDDEYRQIDWKATARRRKPISRVYELEKSQNVLLCLDAGRMMAAKVGGLAKLDYAINAALMMAYVALSYGDKVGLTIFSSQVDATLPPQRGQQQFYRCLDLLYAVKPELCYVNYKAALQHIALRNKRRSLIVIFTDLLDEETSQELVEYVRLLRPTHLPLCVTLNDANIVALTETIPHETADVYARAAALEMLNERKRLLDSLTQQGVLVLDRTPEEISVAVVNRYLELKARQVI